jgi:hypothetical protein
LNGFWASTIISLSNSKLYSKHQHCFKHIVVIGHLLLYASNQVRFKFQISFFFIYGISLHINSKSQSKRLCVFIVLLCINMYWFVAFFGINICFSIALFYIMCLWQMLLKRIVELVTYKTKNSTPRYFSLKMNFKIITFHINSFIRFEVWMYTCF